MSNSGPDGLAHPADILQVFRIAVGMADLHLDRRVAFRLEAQRLLHHRVGFEPPPDAGAVSGRLGAVMAPEPVQRHPRGLSHNVPERHVDGRQRQHRRPAAPVRQRSGPELAPDRLDLARVAPDQVGNHGLHQALLHRAEALAQIKLVAEPDMARARLDLDRQHIALPRIAALEGRLLPPGQHQQVNPDILYAHRSGLPLASYRHPRHSRTIRRASPSRRVKPSLSKNSSNSMVTLRPIPERSL